MKLTVDSKAFAEAVAWVTKDYDMKDSSAYIALKVGSDGQGVLSHMNFESFMKMPLPFVSVDFGGDEEDSVELALDGKYLQRLSAALGSSAGDIVISKKLGDSSNDDDSKDSLLMRTSPLQVKSSMGKFTIPTFIANVPEEPTISEIGETSEAEYFDSIQRVAKLTDTFDESVIPAIGAVDVRFEVENGQLSLMATDRFTLGEILLDFTPADDAEDLLDEAGDILVPFSNASMIAASKSPDTVKIIFDKDSRKYGYSFADGRVALFSLVDTDAIEYKPLIENANNDIENSVVLSTSGLKSAVSNISNLAWDESDVWINLSANGEVTVTDEHKTNKQVVDSESSEIEEDITVVFNRSALNKVFSPISTAKLRMGWVNQNQQFCFSLVLDDGTVADHVTVIAQPVSS